MGKKLIITEKPSVARDFARVLGVTGNHQGYIENNDYVISWCYGHLVCMSYPEAYDEKYHNWRLEDLPFLPETYKYEVVESAKDQYVVVNKMLHRDDIDTVYWAGDSGKEGQTIEENIRIYGGVRPGMTELRVWIDSQTDEEILRGIREAKPMSDYDLLGKSGIMRTIEDYSLGINFSRVLSVKYGKMFNDAAATKTYTAIAVGRVMTCVLGMVVRREREIRDFKETPFYRVNGNFSEAKINAEWKAEEGSKYFESPLLYKENGFKARESAEKLIQELTGKPAIIANKEIGTEKKKPPMLFNLAELQAECSKRFKISPAQTLEVVQKLYEQKMTTYPRTDARVLSTAIAKEIDKTIIKLQSYTNTKPFVDKILADKSYVGIEKTPYTDDSKITDHYAIIPTGQIGALSRLSDLEKSIYDLIVRRFLSIFYPPAEYKKLKLHIKVDTENFYTSTKILVKPGYLEVTGYKSGSEDENSEEEGVGSKEKFEEFISKVKKGDTVVVNFYEIKEGKTSPPKRYTSGSLILAMENAGKLIEDEELRAQIIKVGIGTSATRGEILQKLIKIGYLNLNEKSQIITPENLGEMVYEVVDLTLPSLLNPEMSASWEKGLEGIVKGEVNDKEYRSKLEDYIRTETLKMIGEDLRVVLATNIKPFISEHSKGISAKIPIGVACPICKGDMVTTSFGYGCSNYFNEEIKCRFSVGKIAGVDVPQEEVVKLINEGTTGVIKGFTSKTKKKFDAKLKLVQDEEGKFSVNFDFTDIEPEYLEGAVCPDCGGRLAKKSMGYGCEKYNRDDANSCKFFVGKIASKELSVDQLKELINEGKTKTIRGFKSKAGKRFDACLVLKKDEQGHSQVSFDFDNVEDELLPDVSCPLCGKAVKKVSEGYDCIDFNRGRGPCSFNLRKVYSVLLSDAQVKDLLKDGTTKVIKTFKTTKGEKFAAKIQLDKNQDGKVTGIKFVKPD